MLHHIAGNADNDFPKYDHAGLCAKRSARNRARAHGMA